MHIQQGLIRTALLLSVVLGGCHKEDAISPVDVLSWPCSGHPGCRAPLTRSSILVGSWEIRQRIGGLMPGEVYSPGNGSILKFTLTDYEMYSKGQLDKRGTYSVVTEKSFLNDQLMSRLIYDNHDDPSSKTFFEVSHNKLTLYYGTTIAADGTETEYDRVN